MTNKLVERNKSALAKAKKESCKKVNREEAYQNYFMHFIMKSKQKTSRFMLKLLSCSFETFWTQKHRQVFIVHYFLFLSFPQINVLLLFNVGPLLCLSVAGKLVSEWDCLAKYEGGQYCTLASYYGESVCATSDYKDINSIFLSYSLNKISIYLKQLKYCPASSSGPILGSGSMWGHFSQFSCDCQVR